MMNIEIVGKAAFETLPSERKENLLMETAMRIQETFDDMYFAHHVNPDMTDYYGSAERYGIFLEWAREFEYRYYQTERYEHNWYESSREFAEAKIKEVFG